MVSFQCDGCTDVVKKPKLDRHYGQCRASFTCIDCSATFTGPLQWKSHTSCITEAEKYQKSLYKGPKKGQDSGPSNGNHKNTQRPEITKTSGEYHQSRSNQRSWSRRQYIPNYVSGANSTPLGSPLQMSPIDSSTVEAAVYATKTECEAGNKGDPKVPVEVDTLNTAQPKPKMKKRHDVSGKDEKAGVVSEPPQEPPTVVNGSTKKGKEGSKSETQTPPKETIPEKDGDGDEKKSKKRKRKVSVCDGPNHNDSIERKDAQVEATSFHSDDQSKDEKKAKKRKHKEKIDDGSQPEQSDVAGEETAEAAPGARKKKKSKDRKPSAEKVPMGDEGTVDENRKKTESVEKPKKRRERKSERHVV